jgi:uncharacterized protein YdaU (DUF1376 family)
MPRYFLNINIGDYLRDTQGLGAMASGGYLHLLMHYTAHGSLPTDDETLRTIARMDAQQWRRTKPKIKKFFDDGWRQTRIEADLSTQDRISALRKAAGKRGGSATRIKQRTRLRITHDA